MAGTSRTIPARWARRSPRRNHRQRRRRQDLRRGARRLRGGRRRRADSPSDAGKNYELAGDETFTLANLAAEVSRQTGKTIVYKNLPESDYAAALAGFGLPAPFAAAIAGWGVGIAKGALYDDGRQLSALIGRPTTLLSAAVAAALK